MEVGALMSVASRLFECAVLVGLGYNLKTAGLLKNSDGETAAKLGAFLTLPALILQHLAWSGRVSLVTATSLASAAAFAAATGVFNWWYHDSRHKRERAVLAGSSVGSATALVGYPVVEAVWGGAGVQAAALADISCVPAELVASYLLVASAGPAFPQDYKHDDGGSYRGEWRGLKKEGLGTYTYPSDAKYEGEWRDNLKSGRGVYYFPAGGTYEGEWSGGSMHGVGVRTFSTGQVKAGRWEYNQLVEPMDVWQCSNAVEGATEAALAARRVEVGGGTPQDGLQQLLQYPPLWAILGGLVLNLLHLPLPHAVDSVTRVLAPANKPLMLLAFGLMLNIEKVQPRQVSDLCVVLGSRAVIPLFLAGTLLGACGARAPAATLPVLVALVAVLAPVSRSVQVYARRFRLNEPLAAALGNASQLVSPVVMACVALGAAALGAAPADPAVPFVPASGVPVAILLLLLAAALSVAVQQLYATHKPALNVKMVYKGLPTPAAGQTQPGAADATAATAGGTSDGGSPVPGGTSSSGSSNVDRSSPGSGEVNRQQQQDADVNEPDSGGGYSRGDNDTRGSLGTTATATASRSQACPGALTPLCWRTIRLHPSTTVPGARAPLLHSRICPRTAQTIKLSWRHSAGRPQLSMAARCTSGALGALGHIF